jgi:hypothetical protein
MQGVSPRARTTSPCPFCTSVLKTHQGLRTHITRLHKDKPMPTNFAKTISIATLQEEKEPESILVEYIQPPKKRRGRGKAKKNLVTPCIIAC